MPRNTHFHGLHALLQDSPCGATVNAVKQAPHMNVGALARKTGRVRKNVSIRILNVFNAAEKAI